MEHGDPKSSPITAHDESAIETEQNEVYSASQSLQTGFMLCRNALLMSCTSVICKILKGVVTACRRASRGIGTESYITTLAGAPQR